MYIRPILPHEIPVAKTVIYTVARGIYRPHQSLEEATAHYEAEGILHDMDDIEQVYFAGGTFLVAVEAGGIIGTGGVRRLDDEVCELKRLWFLPEYQGRGFGYRMVMELFATARGKGYKKMRLQTDPHSQTRALAFYQRLGFYEIPRYNDNVDSISMELLF